jgi:peptidoglycan/LPS O-acetylase OafA/YrhL
LVAGPAILALMPVWLLGAWAAARWAAGDRLSPKVAAFVFALAPLLVVGVNLTGADLLLRDWLKDLAPAMWHLGNSQRFATDYVLGLALAMHLLAFSSLPAGLRARIAGRRKHLALLAGFSFTLYLFHRPLTQAVGAYFPQWGQSRWGAVSVAGAIITFCWLVSFLTERQLPWWRQRVRTMFDRVGAGSERPQS